MHRWSKMRQKLEQEYLADSLRGRLTYFITNYHKMHDGDEGRVAVRLDGAEVLKSNYFERMERLWAHLYRDASVLNITDDAERWKAAGQKMLHDGAFFQIDVYRAFQEYDNHPVSESLVSENALVRMFALLDRRTGKRTLERIRERMRQEPQWMQMIYLIRLEAEQMPLAAERKPMKKGILFDLDGTLWDSSAQVIDAWNACLREQTDRSEQFTLEDMHNFMGRTIEVIAAMMFPSLPQAEQLRLLELCTEREHSYLTTHPARIFDGEQAIMEQLSREYALGVVSNCQDGYIQIYLDQCGFSHLFCDFECAGKTGLSKGENIRLVMERQGITDCIYVGDTQGDCDAADRAGIPFVHAAYGFGTCTHCAAALSDISALPEAAARIFAAAEGTA